MDRLRSVLVLTKWMYIGDTVMAVPLLRATRRAFPEARITALTGSAAATALQNCPCVDTVLPYDPYRAHRGARHYLRLLRSVRSEIRPDLCLVANRSVRSALIAFASGARVRAGYARPAHRRLLTHPVPRDGDRPEAECHLGILRAVAPEPAEEPDDLVPRLWISREERERGARLLAEQRTLGPLLVGVQPGASQAAKQWGAARFAAVADALAAEGASIVILGGPDEIEAARAMRGALRAPCVDLTGATSLRETMGVLSHLSLFVSNDTGIRHVAAALDVPTVALFGPTPASKWGNAGPNSAVLAAPGGEIERIPVGEVVAAARGLLREEALVKA